MYESSHCGEITVDKPKARLTPKLRLTPREEQVLRHVRSGASNKDIADTLGISEQGVKALVSRLLAKFDVPNRTTLSSVAGGREQRDAMHALHDAIDQSRELRDQNAQLMASVRLELRQVRIQHLHLMELAAKRGGRAANSRRGARRGP